MSNNQTTPCIINLDAYHPQIKTLAKQVGVNPNEISIITYMALLDRIILAGAVLN